MSPPDPETDYAFWTPPDKILTVEYPLSVFHEIDFEVNEGYRRIPHGGVETGGLLFGHAERNSVRIETFRNIECEHALGPSFVLSEQDLARLRQQIATAPSDPDLHGLEIIGWYIGHTRSPMKMNDRECALFDELFPEPGGITMLVKPERFQPTRFGFLVRRPDRQYDKDASQGAIILPLPGRASRSGEGPIPSIPAPAAAPAAPPPPAAKPEPRPAARPGLSSRVAASPPASLPPPAVQKHEVVPVLAPIPLTPIPEKAPAEEVIEVPASHQKTRKLGRDATRSNLRFALVLLVAAALGCAVGYWAYSQLPSATISLNVHAEPSALLISWPSEQTRDAVYAALRVDDGQPVPLTPEEKAAGEAEKTAPGDSIKIELITQHWIRNSRGIIRYVKPLPPVTMQMPQPETPH